MLIGLGSAGAAHAATPDFDGIKAKGPQALLENSDKLVNDYPSQKWTLRMTVMAPGGAPRTLRFKVWQKGRGNRLVRFIEPGEVKGMSMLSQPDEVMYVYAPQTDNVRRLALSARRQTLLGSNWTYSDMSSLDLAPAYTATMAEADAGGLWLDLNLKAGVDRAWSHLRVHVAKATTMVDAIEYFDGAKKARTQERKAFEIMEGVPTYRSVVMSDVGTGLKTELYVEEQKIGEDIPDSFFQKRNLVRGQ